MTNITELTAEKLEEIRQRYRPTLAPKCHICGVEMTIQRMSASRITYGCAGAFYDETGCHYAEGRSLADDHYAESRITVVDVSDPDVLAMVEALEGRNALVALQKIEIRELNAELEKAQSANAAQDDHINQQQDRIEQLERRNAEIGKYAGSLETSHRKLRESMAAIHNTVRLDGVNTRLSTILSASKRAYDESATAIVQESRTVTVKLPPELYTIGELIRTQDNRITDQPMFVVFQKREIIGSDEHSPSRVCWVWDGEEVSELRAKRLEALYQDGRDTRGYDRYAMQEVDEFVTACFTEHGCKDYLRQNGHNLRLPYIYACGSFRNNEYQLVRNWLADIKVEAE